MAGDRVIWLRYHSFGSDELTERKVEPYSLVFYGDDWHVVGYCRLREGMRDFRASRIRDAELLPERFERMPGLYMPARGAARRARYFVRVWLDAAVFPWAREQPAFGFEREEPAEGGAVFDVRLLGLAAADAVDPRLGRRPRGCYRRPRSSTRIRADVDALVGTLRRRVANSNFSAP